MKGSLQRLTLYTIIIGIESDLRELIKNNLSSVPLCDVFNPTLLDKLRSRRSKELGGDAYTEEINELLEYSDLGDATAVIFKCLPMIPEGLAKYFKRTIQKIEKIIPVRNRVMHGRPLDFDDYGNVTALSKELTRTRTDFWHTLRSNIEQIKENPDFIFSIDSDFLYDDESPVFHNLPQPDFDDTGFIGRDELLKAAKTAIRGPYPVITIVGEGGLGKTAIALKLCYDLLDEPNCAFEAIVWTSAKANRLTAYEIASIDSAVVSSIGLFEQATGVFLESKPLDPINSLIDHLSSFPTLLVIDNLETVLDENIISLVRQIPDGSKVLFTTRIGLGAMDFPIKLSPFSEKEAEFYFRRTSEVWGVNDLSRIPKQEIKKYLNKLKNNPLFIKWFVQTVRTGKRPQSILANPKILLEYCLQNVLDYLDDDSRTALSAMISTKPPHSFALLAYYTEFDNVRLQKALVQLIACNVVSMKIEKSLGEEYYSVSDLARMYVVNYVKVRNEDQERLRKLENQLNVLDSDFKSQDNSDIYNMDNLFIRDKGDYVPAKLLKEAMRELKKKNINAAADKVMQAVDIAPGYFEAKRVEAVLASHKSDLNHAEDCFEAAISLSPDHSPLYLWYGYFVFKSLNDIERAKILFQKGLQKDVEGSEIKLGLSRMLIISREFEQGRTVLRSIRNLELLPEKRKRIYCDLVLQSFSRECEWKINQQAYDGALDALKGLRVQYEALPKRWVDRKARENIGRLALRVRDLEFALLHSERAEEASALVDWFESGGFVAKKSDFTVTRPSEEEGNPKFVGSVSKVMQNYGFIAYKNEDIFFHRGEWLGPGEFDEIKNGDAVSFSVGRNYIGPCAVRVSTIENG